MVGFCETLCPYVEGDFLLNKINFVGGDKLLPVFKHGFLRSEENVFPVFLYTQNVYGKMLSFTIYRYKCDRVECDEEYIGESSRNFGERFKEHQKAPSPIYDHYNITGHNINIENFEIVGRESQNLMRTIKEALYIRVNDPSLNRNIGKYHLPHIWDEVLHNISELKLKN